MNEIGSQKKPMYKAATTMTLKNHPPSWTMDAHSFLPIMRSNKIAWKTTRAKVILKTAETPKHADS